MNSCGAIRDIRPRKSLHQLAAQSGVPRALACRTTELLKLHPNKITDIQQPFPLDWDTRSQYCKQFQELVVREYLDPGFMFCFYEAWFTLSGNVNCHSDKFGVKKFPIHFLKLLGMALNSDTRVCAYVRAHVFVCEHMRACIGKIIRFVFLKERVNSCHYSQLFLSSFFGDLEPHTSTDKNPCF